MGRSRKHFVRRWMGIGLMAGSLLAGSIGLVGSSAAQSQPRDCDDNSVLRCGAYSVNEVKEKYRQNQGGNTHAIFREFGITSEAMLDGMVAGRVTRNNEVYVGDRLVATNAVTVGRHNIPGSTAILNGGAYTRPPSVSFARDSLPALIKMDGDTFQYGVISSCGNPMRAQPVPPPAPPPPPPPAPQPPPPPPSQPKVPEFEVEKDVRNVDSTDFMNQVSARQGDELEYRIRIRNTGETTLENVMVRDELPTGLAFIGDSLRVDGEEHEGNPTGDAVDIGSIAVDREVVVTYRATVGNDVEACGDDRLRNVVRVQPRDLPEKQDDAFVEVCLPQVKAKVTPPPPVPQILPKTGAASEIIALFSAFTIGGTAARLVFVRYRAR